MKNRWQHPDYPEISVNPRIAAAIVLMRMGMTDLGQLARATGLSQRRIAELDEASDPVVRHLAVVGVPPGHFFPLRDSAQCPQCLHRVTVVPCVSCAAAEKRREQLATRDS